jgi:hypothetical protein
MAIVICGYTWGMCAMRSGKGHSNPHLCTDTSGQPHSHVCTACRTGG